MRGHVTVSLFIKWLLIHPHYSGPDDGSWLKTSLRTRAAQLLLGSESTTIGESIARSKTPYAGCLTLTRPETIEDFSSPPKIKSREASV